MLLTPAHIVTLITRSRRVLIRTLYDDIRRKHAGSVFGMSWFIIMPLLFLGFYATVYLVVYKVKPASMSPVDYLHFIYIGLMAYLGLSEGMTAGAGSLIVNRAVVLNTVFPAELLPLRAALVGQMTFLLGFVLAICWTLATGKASVWLMLLPLVVAMQILFSIGLAWILAPIYVVFRDLGQILNFVVLAILVISPIAFRSTELTGYQKIMLYINPLYFYLASYQSILFDGTAPPLVPFLMGAVACLVVFFIGFRFFVRVKPMVAEHV